MMTTRQIAQVALRWTARILGILLAGLVFLLAVGQGVRFQDFNLVTGSMMVGLLVALTGMLHLWRSELIGGTMVLVGMVGFYAIDFLSSGDLPGGWLLPVCFLPGFLALASWAGRLPIPDNRRCSTCKSRQMPARAARLPQNVRK